MHAHPLKKHDYVVSLQRNSSKWNFKNSLERPQKTPK